MIVAIGLLVVGLVILSVAADRFVEHAARLATALRISTVVVGAVVIGFGTSAPELLASGLAARQGDVDVGVGNIVGSNIANISLVLGAAAIIRTIAVSDATMRREAPLSVVSVLLFAVLVRGGMGVAEGAVLLAGLLFFLFVSIRAGLGAEPETDTLASDRPAVDAAWMVAWLVITVAGAQMLVTGATRLADELEISGGFVGLTIVAIGTSLPELVTAIAAARRGETDLIIGNLLGSNIFNSLAVGGTVAVVGAGNDVDPDLANLPVFIMAAVAISVWGALQTGRKIVRWEGAILLGVYLATLPFMPR